MTCFPRPRQIDISDIAGNADKMILHAVKNVLMNNFSSLVDIFLHYARPRQVQGMEAEGAELAVSMKSMATFVRTCRLSSEDCSFFEIQRACVRPFLLLPTSEEEWSLGLYEADFRMHEFLEALIRIASLKNFGLSAACDQVPLHSHSSASVCCLEDFHEIDLFQLGANVLAKEPHFPAPVMLCSARQYAPSDRRMVSLRSSTS